MFPTILIYLMIIPSMHPAPLSVITPSFTPTRLTLIQDSIRSTVSINEPKTKQNVKLTTDSLFASVRAIFPTTTKETLQTSKLYFLDLNAPTDIAASKPCNNCSIDINLNYTDIKTNGTTIVELVRHRYHNHFVITIGSLSLIALILNFVFLTKLFSCNGVSVIVLFGICLFLFNIILSFYGIALAVYLYKGPIHWNNTFCQGFTSIKLLALGSGIWTLIMLTFQHSIRESSNGERDAVFKGIVYVLEGVMLSGVMAVMSWIKLDAWGYLCAILEPTTTVEWLLTGIELWFYLIALLLIVRYPIHLVRRKKEIEAEKIKSRSEQHPIFFMILICFILWALAFTLTLPHVKLVGPEFAAIIRSCTLMFVIVLQPILYLIRGTFCCTGKNFPCSKKKNDITVENVLLVCECSGSETCPACDSEYDPKAKYGDTVFTEPPSKGVSSSDEKLNKELNGKSKENKKKKHPKVEETEKIVRKNKKRKKNKNQVASPKVCRSPEVRATLKSINSETDGSDNEKEDVPLLDKQTENAETQLSEGKQRNLKHVPLLDDTDGKSNAPKAFPDNSPFKASQPDDNLDSPNSRNRPSEFPSFINMNTAINVDELPKEVKHPKVLELQLGESGNSLTATERVSRGPTFYTIPDKNNENQLPEKDNTVEDSKQIFIKNIEVPSCQDNSKDDLPVDAKNKKKKKKDAEKKNKRKKEKLDVDEDPERKEKHKKKKTKKNKTKTKSGDSSSTKKTSTISLEWDHECPSSGSGSLVDDKAPSAEMADSDLKKKETSNKDYNMEWDPSDCTMKTSPNIQSIPTQASPAPEWEPYATEEGRSSSVVNRMSKPTAHLSNDVSFDHAAGDLENEQSSQINENQNVDEPEIKDHQDENLDVNLKLEKLDELKDIESKKDKTKKKQINNGKVKKPKKKDKTKDKVKLKSS